MIPFRCIPLWAALALAAAVRADDTDTLPVVHLREEARAADRFVRLGDVADLHGDPSEIARLARFVLAEAPVGRQPLTLARRDIEDRLARMGLRGALRLRGADRVRVAAPNTANTANARAGAGLAAYAMGKTPVPPSASARADAGALPAVLDEYTRRRYADASPEAREAVRSFRPRDLDAGGRAAYYDAAPGAPAPVASLLPPTAKPVPALPDRWIGLDDVASTARSAGAPVGAARPAAPAAAFRDDVGSGRLLAGDYRADPVHGVRVLAPVAEDAAVAFTPETPAEWARWSVARHLRDLYPGDRVEVAVLVRAVHAPLAGPATVSVLRGKLPGVATVLLRGEDGRQAAADVEAVVDVPALALRRAVENGQEIAAADLRLVRHRAVAGQATPLGERPEGVAWRATRRLTGEKPLFPGDVAEPFAVARDETLSVASQGQGWTLNSRAVALQDGRHGDRIAARSAHDGARWWVRITGPGRADFLGRADAASGKARPKSRSE